VKNLKNLHYVSFTWI